MPIASGLLGDRFRAGPAVTTPHRRKSAPAAAVWENTSILRGESRRGRGCFIRAGDRTAGPLIAAGDWRGPAGSPVGRVPPLLGGRVCLRARSATLADAASESTFPPAGGRRWREHGAPAGIVDCVGNPGGSFFGACPFARQLAQAAPVPPSVSCRQVPFSAAFGAAGPSAQCAQAETAPCSRRSVCANQISGACLSSLPWWRLLATQAPGLAAWSRFLRASVCVGAGRQARSLAAVAPA